MSSPSWGAVLKYIIDAVSDELNGVLIYTDRPAADTTASKYLVLSLLDINPEYTLGGHSYYTATVRVISVAKEGAVAALELLDTVQGVLAGTTADINGDEVQFVYQSTRQVEVEDGWVYQSEYKIFYIQGS